MAEMSVATIICLNVFCARLYDGSTIESTFNAGFGFPFDVHFGPSFQFFTLILALLYQNSHFGYTREDGGEGVPEPLGPFTVRHGQDLANAGLGNAPVPISWRSCPLLFPLHAIPLFIRSLLFLFQPPSPLPRSCSLAQCCQRCPSIVPWIWA